MEPLFRGYVLTKDKQCLENFKGVKRLKTLDDVRGADEFAAILGEDTILIDVDDGPTSDLLFSMVQDLGLKCRVYATTRGKHFYFRNPEGTVEKSWTKQTLAVGIKTDAKVGRNNSYAIMRFKGVDRAVLLNCPEDEIQVVPKWLTPVKTNQDFITMEAGDGRNTALYTYILTLQSEDLSDFENNMEENPRNTILILKDYDGENLGEFRRNLATYGVVKVRENGGVDSLGVVVTAENYKAILELFKKALIENAGGYDAKDDRLSGNPNQMNIQSMYSDIDLDANGMETEFQAAFEQLLWFVNQDLKTKGAGDFEQEEITVIFNRDILINESEAITNCQNSVGILSNETIVEQHPWTKDAQTELERLKKEKAEAMSDYMGAFPPRANPNNPNGDTGGDQ